MGVVGLTCIYTVDVVGMCQGDPLISGFPGKHTALGKQREEPMERCIPERSAGVFFLPRASIAGQTSEGLPFACNPTSSLPPALPFLPYSSVRLLCVPVAERGRCYWLVSSRSALPFHARCKEHALHSKQPVEHPTIWATSLGARLGVSFCVSNGRAL